MKYIQLLESSRHKEFLFYFTELMYVTSQKVVKDFNKCAKGVSDIKATSNL